MKWVQGIRERWGSWKLRQMSGKVTRERAQQIRWSEKPTIGLLYFFRPEEEQVLRQWIKEKTKKGFSIQTLGFTELKKGETLPVSEWPHQYFSQRELNWYCQPVSEVARQFIGMEFDVLIDLDRAEKLPVRHVLQQSKARLKIGRCGEEVSFDLCFEVDRNTDIHSFLKITEQYLEMLDATKNQTG